MTTTRNGVDGGYKCRVRLEQILAIVVRKEGCIGDPGDFWMYENGYLLFQVSETKLTKCKSAIFLKGSFHKISFVPPQQIVFIILEARFDK